jgi:hypothetical protein
MACLKKKKNSSRPDVRGVTNFVGTELTAFRIHQLVKTHVNEEVVRPNGVKRFHLAATMRWMTIQVDDKSL